MSAKPSDGRCWDLVGYGVTENGGMTPAGDGTIARDTSDIRGTEAVVQISDVTLRSKPDHHAQSIAIRFVEQPCRRWRVCTDRVHAIGSHQLKIPRNDVP